MVPAAPVNANYIIIVGFGCVHDKGLHTHIISMPVMTFWPTIFNVCFCSTLTVCVWKWLLTSPPDCSSVMHLLQIFLLCSCSGDYKLDGGTKSVCATMVEATETFLDLQASALFRIFWSKIHCVWCIHKHYRYWLCICIEVTVSIRCTFITILFNSAHAVHVL